VTANEWGSLLRAAALQCPHRGQQSLAVLLIAHVFQPIDHLAVELLLDAEVRHAHGGRRDTDMEVDASQIRN
jgi:hypothetical protein